MLAQGVGLLIINVCRCNIEVEKFSVRWRGTWGPCRAKCARPWEHQLKDNKVLDPWNVVSAIPRRHMH